MTQCSYIIGAKRSPIVPRGGALATLNLHELAAPVVQALIESVQLDAQQVDELIVGNALGAGGNPARLIALASGLDQHVAGMSIDRQCCSGLDALLIANDMIVSGRASVVIAGGAESYSQRPVRYRKKPQSDELQAYDQPPFTPWPDRDPDMGVAADELANELHISFEQQNQWAINSHQNALRAAHQLPNEIVPINNVNSDSFTRNLSMKLCQRATRIHGNISQANTAVAADGAAFCVVVSEEIAARHSGPKYCIRLGVTLGADPTKPGLAPVPAIESILKSAGIDAMQLQRTEIMEAYAAQAIACVQQSGINAQTCNVGGGALARGHPIGASGTVLMVRLINELQTVGGLGLAAIAAAGGLGTAVLIECVS